MHDHGSFEALGVRVNAAPFDAVLQTVLAAPDTGGRLAIHFATAHTIVEANRSAAVRSALSVGLVEPDGMPIVWLGRRAGLGAERVCGPDFMPTLIERGIPLGRSHFFYGGTPEIVDALARGFARRFPGLRVAGTHSPPFRALTADEDAQVTDLINAAAPDYVWVGLGAPKQDLWVADHRSRLDAPALLAVGAAFEFHSGRRRRAPRWMQRSGTEWLFRLVSEPRRLVGRYTSGNLAFLRLLLARELRRLRHRGDRHAAS